MRTLLEPSEPHHPCLPIVRPPATGKVDVYPLAPRHTIVCLHRMKGRTLPCLDDPCPFCVHLMRQDEKLFFPARRAGDGAIVIVELPRSHHEHLIGVILRYGSLRNVYITLERTMHFANAPIKLSGGKCHAKFTAIADHRTLLDDLARIWTKNVEFALDTIMAENPTSKFDARRAIGGRHDS